MPPAFIDISWRAMNFHWSRCVLEIIPGLFCFRNKIQMEAATPHITPLTPFTLDLLKLGLKKYKYNTWWYYKWDGLPLYCYQSNFRGTSFRTFFQPAGLFALPFSFKNGFFRWKNAQLIADAYPHGKRCSFSGAPWLLARSPDRKTRRIVSKCKEHTETKDWCLRGDPAEYYLVPWKKHLLLGNIWWEHLGFWLTMHSQFCWRFILEVGIFKGAWILTLM